MEIRYYEIVDGHQDPDGKQIDYPSDEESEDEKNGEESDDASLMRLKMRTTIGLKRSLMRLKRRIVMWLKIRR